MIHKTNIHYIFKIFLMFLIICQFHYMYSEETPFLPTDNAYNPIPSPDGTKIAFVRTGNGRSPILSMGRYDMRSDVMVADKNGKLISEKPLADSFLAGWTPDSNNLVCYRDGRFSLVNLQGNKTEEGHIPDPINGPERIQYSTKIDAFVWHGHGTKCNAVISEKGTEIAHYDGNFSDWLSISGDGQWLATISDRGFIVFNMTDDTWINLGNVTIHPDFSGLDYKTAWNPWFKDNTYLSYISKNKVVVALPDGKEKRELCTVENNCGLATPSPDGRHIAYVMFVKKQREIKDNETPWESSQIWLVSNDDDIPKPIPVTSENKALIFNLRWLDNDEIIFDRFEDTSLFAHAGLWRVKISFEDEN